MKNYILLDRYKIEKRIENLEQLKETSKNPQIVNYFDGLINSLKALLENGEDLKSLLQQAFEAAREETPWSDPNTGDISYEFPNFEDWYNKEQE